MWIIVVCLLQRIERRFFICKFIFFQQQAAATTVYVAAAEDLEGVTGLYFNNCFYCEESALARDRDIANTVFEMSLKMIEERMGNEYIERYTGKMNSV